MTVILDHTIVPEPQQAELGPIPGVHSGRAYGGAFARFAPVKAWMTS